MASLPCRFVTPLYAQFGADIWQQRLKDMAHIVILDLREQLAAQALLISELKDELKLEKTASRQVISSLSTLEDRKRKRQECGGGRLTKKEQDKENELLRELAEGVVAIKARD